MMDTTKYLTGEKFKELEKELEILKTVRQRLQVQDGLGRG